MAKIADFEGNPVELSEVLPVEISTIRSGLSSSFTGKKIMSFGLTVEILMQKALPPHSSRFWTPLLYLMGILELVFSAIFRVRKF